MKKCFAWILLIPLTLSLVGCGLFTPGIPYEFSYSSSQNYTAGSTTVENATALDTVFISWYAGNVTVETHQESSVIIEETATGITEDAQQVHYWYQRSQHGDGDVLFVEFGKSGLKDYDGIQKDLRVLLPENDHYHISFTGDSSNFYLDVDNYENTLEKLSATTNCGDLHANLYHADIVQIAGNNVDEDGAESKTYQLNAVGKIGTLGMNSTYAKIIINADWVASMDSVGSVCNETRFTANKAGNIKIQNVQGVTHIQVKEFSSMDLDLREKPVYIYIPQDCGFTLRITREKYVDGEEDLVSDVVEIGFEGFTKISDTEYTVGNSEKTIHVTTYNEIHVLPLD
jgi:hypothetical protein